ncbi:MAG: D-aminoacylase [Acidobacteria bacterium]|nr:D-aminoacylase [Acidobacteriota bacterium]
MSAFNLQQRHNVRWRQFFWSLPLVLLSGVQASWAQPATYDVLISHARIVDGTGAPWFTGDIGIVGERIAAIGQLRDATAKRLIDARNLVAAPGFIDLQGQSEFNLLVDNRAASKITQGVTTEITGEGTSIAPVNERLLEDLRDNATKYGVALDWRSLDEYLKRLDRARPAINLGTFVGAGGIRTYVIGKDKRAATTEELAQMRELVAGAMEQGAFGVSSALEYVPDSFASTEELVELAKVAHKYGGVYFTHQRSESDQIFPSLEEVFSIARSAGLSTTIWHLKTAYRESFGKMHQVLDRIKEARNQGIEVAASVYPYTRASNGLVACFPTWVSEGGTGKMLERLQNPDERARVRKEMNEPSSTWDNEWLGSGGAPGVALIQVVNPDLRKYEGMDFEEIGRRMGKDPEDAAMDIAIADRGNSQVVISIMEEADVRAAVLDPLVSYGSDSPAQAEDGPLSTTKAHPRAFGTFPRILAQYVRTEHGMRLEEAIRKMTSQAASRVGIVDRGILRPGMAADITVFDPATIRDVATYNEPLHYSTGVKYVFVNGRPVVLDGRITSERPGHGLRGPGYLARH